MKRTIIGPEATSVKTAELEQEMDHPDSEVREKLAKHKRALQKYDTEQQFLYPIEKIAQDKLVILNVKYPGSDEDYPHEQQALYRFVNREYPNALGGVLYVDEPKNENEVHRAYERHEKMKDRKLRHVVMMKDTTYEDILQQLGEDI